MKCPIAESCNALIGMTKSRDKFRKQLQVVNAGIKSAALIMSKETGRDVRDLEDAKKKFSEALKLIKDAEE